MDSMGSRVGRLALSSPYKEYTTPRGGCQGKREKIREKIFWEQFLPREGIPLGGMGPASFFYPVKFLREEERR